MRGSAEAVASARTRIELLIDDAVRRSAPSHFVCISLRAEALDRSLEVFRTQAMSLIPVRKTKVLKRENLREPCLFRHYI